jgi:hypothetical protein
MLLGAPEPSEANFSRNRFAARSTSCGLSTTFALPAACTPFVSRQSEAYSSIAKETIGFCPMCRATVDSGRVHT